MERAAYQVVQRCKEALDVPRHHTHIAPMVLIALSLIANVAITFAVTYAIWRNTAGMTEAFGPDTPARRILACLYFTIGTFSLGGLILLVFGQPFLVLGLVIVLLPLQIFYKLLTLPALGPSHPVALANLGVVVLHTATLLGVYVFQG